MAFPNAIFYMPLKDSLEYTGESFAVSVSGSDDIVFEENAFSATTHNQITIELPTPIETFTIFLRFKIHSNGVPPEYRYRRLIWGYDTYNDKIFGTEIAYAGSGTTNKLFLSKSFTDALDDGNWHTCVVKREGSTVTCTVDDTYTDTVAGSWPLKKIMLSQQSYALGGLIKDVAVYDRIVDDEWEEPEEPEIPDEPVEPDEPTEPANTDSIYKHRMYDYYPAVIQSITEFKAIIDGEYPEFDLLYDGANGITEDAYLLTMGEERIEQWEQLLGIRPIENSSVSDRRETIVARIRGQGKLNTSTINAIVNAFTGGTANSWVEDSVLYVEITPPPNSKNFQFANVEQELSIKVPAHLGFKVSRNYFEWRDIKANFATWGDVKNNLDTWDDVFLFVPFQ